MSDKQWGGRREGSGRPSLFGEQATKVARIPTTWDPRKVWDDLEAIESILQTAEAEIAQAAAVGKDGRPSNRWWKMAELVGDLREVLPKREL